MRTSNDYYDGPKDYLEDVFTSIKAIEKKLGTEFSQYKDQYNGGDYHWRLKKNDSIYHDKYWAREMELK